MSSQSPALSPSPEIEVWRTKPRPIPKALTPAQKLGLQYERRVVKTMRAQGLDIEHNPWFRYRREGVTGYAVPDVLIHLPGLIVVAEIKLTYTPEALTKLQDLYCPIARSLFALDARPLVIVKNLTADVPSYWHNINEALGASFPIYQWLGHSRIVV